MSLVPRAVSPLRLAPPVRVLALVAAFFLSACGREEAGKSSSASAGDPTASAPAADAAPPPNARERVGTVIDAFLAARSYHATLTATGPQGDMLMDLDFVAPDRYRMKAPMGTQYVIGDQLYMTMNGRTLKTALPKGQIDAYRDPVRFAEQKATMTVVALGDEAVDGQPATKYLIRNTQPMPGESTLWVGADGYPLKIEVSERDGGQLARTTIRYSRFNDPTIRVEPPQ